MDSLCPTDMALLAYLLGELAEDDRPAVAVHLMTCDGCHKRLERFRDTGDRIKRHGLKEMGLLDLDHGPGGYNPRQET